MNELIRLLSIDPQLAPTLWPMAIGWVFVFGGAIGSFLNVVIYRLPAGASLSHPGSRCPRCHHSIRTYDNVPILSWLILRGRCRDCRAPISGRYPLVEAFVAVMFVALAIAGPLSGSSDTPSNWGQYAYHMTALCVLLCAALVHYDGKPLPRKLVVFAMVVGLASVMIWPELHDRAISLGQWSMPKSLDALCGAALGAVLGGLARPAARGIARDHPNDSVWLILIVGLFFGWHGVAMIAAYVAAVDLMISVVARFFPAIGRIPRGGICFLVTLAVAITSSQSAVPSSGSLGGDRWLPLLAITLTALCSLTGLWLIRIRFLISL